MVKIIGELPQREEDKNYLREVGIIGLSPAMKELIPLIEKSASSIANVLITGETGTGKELVARAVHYYSERGKTSQKFVAVNCGGIPDTLLESELFGYVGGAFTGASRNGNPGRFEFASGGTIFLDEVGYMSPSMQDKLLRVLQYKKITRVGSNAEMDIDVRVIAATNRDLEELVRDGRFREDLRYRLDVFPIRIPSLRERPEDISELSYYFLTKYRVVHKKNKIDLVDEAMEFLQRHSWPGNVRQLENLMERAVILEGISNTIKDVTILLEKEDIVRLLGSPISVSGAEGIQNSDYFDELTKAYAIAAIEKIKNDGIRLPELIKNIRCQIVGVLVDSSLNITQSARLLGVGRTAAGNYLKGQK